MSTGYTQKDKTDATFDWLVDPKIRATDSIIPFATFVPEATTPGEQQAPRLQVAMVDNYIMLFVASFKRSDGRLLYTPTPNWTKGMIEGVHEHLTKAGVKPPHNNKHYHKGQAPHTSKVN